jgi:hypothetical protein
MRHLRAHDLLWSCVGDAHGKGHVVRLRELLFVNNSIEIVSAVPVGRLERVSVKVLAARCRLCEDGKADASSSGQLDGISSCPFLDNCCSLPSILFACF